MITDADIAARHPDLPGLAVLLDAERLAAALQAEPQAGAGAVSGSPAGAAVALRGTGYRLDRLRIKPGASVSAILRPAAEGPWLLARAFAVEPWQTKRHKDLDAAARALLFAREWPAWRLVVVAAASDRRLRGLARLRPDQGPTDVCWPPGREAADADVFDAKPICEPASGSSRSTTGRQRFRADVRTLSHNPARRWVGAADVGDRRVVLRVHRGHPPQMLPWQAGRPWAPGDPPVSAAPPPGALAGLAPVDVVARVAAAVRGLSMLHRPWGERARAVADTIEGRLARATRAPAHGDLTPDQVVVAGDRVSVLDWDQAGWWPVGWDAATWAAGLIVAGWCGGAARTPEPTVGGQPVDPAVLAAAALLRGPEPFRRRHPQWADRTERLLAYAESLGDAFGRSGEASRTTIRRAAS